MCKAKMKKLNEKVESKKKEVEEVKNRRRNEKIK